MKHDMSRGLEDSGHMRQSRQEPVKLGIHGPTDCRKGQAEREGNWENQVEARLSKFPCQDGWAAVAGSGLRGLKPTGTQNHAEVIMHLE